MRKHRSSFLLSMLMIVLCGSIIIGSTLAYFTSEQTTGENIIAASTLKAGLDWAEQLPESESGWKNAANGVLFNEASWEPNYSAARYIRVKNGGSLAFSYELNVLPTMVVEGGPELMDVIDVYYGVVDADTPAITRSNFAQHLTRMGTMTDLLSNEHGAGYGILLPEGVGVENLPAGAEGESGTVTACIVLHMQQEAGNEYMGLSAGEGFKLQLAAVQYNYDDAFANIPNPSLPDVNGYGTEVLQPVGSTQNGVLTADMVFTSSTGVTATVPAGAKVEPGATQLKLIVTPKAQSDANVQLEDNEVINAWDVCVEGLAKDNTTPVRISLGAVMQKALNIGNYDLYHVEGDATNKMTRVDVVDAAAPHNSYSYDPATGEVVVAMATFSDVSVVAETDAKWEGEYDYTWYDVNKTEYIIANADQLAAFSAIVGGMYEKTADTFKDKTVKLIADIDLNNSEAEGDGDYIFYPIGYYNNTKRYQKDGTTITESDVLPFEGTFDGNGHTIKNIYQNTWEMLGDDPHYAAGSNYYNDAMGLFGYVVNGTVKNLTVDNFISDGEFTPTGVIAAYAVNSTFENIAITNSNPRVYNTGNGGIVGIGGNSDDPDTYKLTFTNITIDNTNKISALWGSWDVACGGLVGMFRGAGHVHMTNCHVAAQMDVYNDVCGNYQYYWYRYSGMMVGTNKNMTTDAEGYTVPETKKFHAKGCTVHFGEWNDYYYCELVANSLASYTHDHQFSRLTEIESLDEIKSGDTWLKAGNFLLINGDSKTCYHIVNKDGTLTQHLHTDAGTETVAGVLGTPKEDKQIIFLPFNQLFTGYGWGVKHIPIYDDGNTYFEGITIHGREVAKSVEKFTANENVQQLKQDTPYTLGTLFTAIEGIDESIKINDSSVIVGITNHSEENPVSATFDSTPDRWQDKTITFTSKGTIDIIIQDYQFCTPTKLKVVIAENEDIQTVEKFEVKFEYTDNFTYRIGNANEVTLSSLFVLKTDNAIVGTVNVSIAPIDGASASGVYTANNSSWDSGAIKFDGTGFVNVTIKDEDAYCDPTVLKLQVVDAYNATTATSAKTKNVVLLNDCGFSSLEVSNGYALYGNGFTMTCTQDSVAADLGYSFVTLDNGTLDNVQIVCPNFDYAALYKSNLTSNDNRKETDANGKTRYYNARSGVMVSGNSQILNSRISGGRAAVNVSGGDVVIDNSRIELGAVANILVGSANNLILKDITLAQEPTASTYDSSKTLLGFSVLFICDSNGNAAPVTLEGELIQRAWVNENDKQYVPSAGQSIVSAVLEKTEYLHDIDGDGTNESLNLGFAYMPENLTSAVNTKTITDNRSNKETVPYDYAEVAILNGKTYVYSYKNTNGTETAYKSVEAYEPQKFSDLVEVTYSDSADGLTSGKSYGTDGWVYELNVNLDKATGYTLDFSKLHMTINSMQISDYTVNGSAKPTSPIAVTAGGTTYTLKATVDGKEYTAKYTVTGTETSKESPSLVAANYEAGMCVASSYGGTWHGAAPALEGIQIKYWSVAEKQYKTITLSDYTPEKGGKQNGTNTTWTYAPVNGDFTLTLTGGQVHSSNSVYAMPVVCGGKLYFVAASSNGLVKSGNSARTIPVSYSFKDNNNGDVLTFSHTWSVAENKDAQYKYSDFCNGTLTKLKASGSSSECVTPDTLITLADGTQKRVGSLTGDEQLLVWNMQTGMLDTAPILFVDSDPEAEFEIVHLFFSDGTDVKVIYEHGFWDYDLNKYVYLDRNADQYIGHWFFKLAGDAGEKVQLVDVKLEKETTTAWSPVTADHLCYFVNGMLSMPGGVGGLFNIFDVDPVTMAYDQEAMMDDIQKYGLFTYDELNALVELPESMFEAAGGAYLKVSIGKGNLTMDELIYMIERYKPFFK